MALTDTAIRNARAAAKPYKLADAGGLFLLITPAGGRLWRMKFRHGPKDGRKEGLLTFGAYPDVTLAQARHKRDAARRQLAEGQNPAEVKRHEALAKAEAVQAEQCLKAGLVRDSFKALALEVIARQEKEGKSPHTLEKSKWLLALLAPLAERPVSEIEHVEMVAVLDTLKERGVYETARKARTFASRVFRHAILTARAKFNPADACKGYIAKPQTRHLAAVIEPTRLGELLRAIDGYPGQPTTKLALRLAPLVFVRPGELRCAEWVEIDLEAAVWRIPAARMKMRREHAVPLSAQAVAILNEAREVTPGGRYVFPSPWTLDKPLSENTLNDALQRLGFAGEATSHGFRATASSLLNECGEWTPDAIERALAHADKNTSRAPYQRSPHWAERVRMSQWWADYLGALRDGSKIPSR